MNIITSIDWTELSIQWMLTCGHFIWQGLVVAIAYLILEQLLALVTNSEKSKTPELTKNELTASTRYMLACGAFLMLPLCFLLTFTVIHNSRGSVLKTANYSIVDVASINNYPTTNLVEINHDQKIGNSNIESLNPQTSTAIKNKETVLNAAKPKLSNLIHAEYYAPIVFSIYAIGVSLLLLRLSLSLFGSFRIRNSAQKITDPKLVEIILTQASRLKLKTVPIVAACVRVSSPFVVGILRPMILLPPSLLCGLDPVQLAAILSHEMAHIRRNDLLINLLQRIVESLLFFHPVTWWISRRMSIERENCCDDLASSFIGKLTYANALVQMASVCLTNNRSRNQALTTLAADGAMTTNFGYRIRRLIDAQDSPQIHLSRRNFTLGLITLSFISGLLLILAQTPQSNANVSPMDTSHQDQQIDGIQWSTYGERNGLLSGARLILPEGGVHPGQPIVVEYRLKNVSKETRKLSCYIRSNWQYITLDTKNRISDMGIEIPEKPVEITIEPGKEYIATSHKASIDTRGFSPGDYQVALGSAFYYPDEVKEGVKHEFPHRGSIPLNILGESKTAINQPLDKTIHWGNAVAGLKLGAKFHKATNIFSIGDVVEADLYLANVTNQAIECTIRLPHPLDGWLFNVENHLGETVMLQRPPFISMFSPQKFYSLKLAPGETKLITGEIIEGQPDKFAGRPAKFEIVKNKEYLKWEDHTIKARLLTSGGKYSAIYDVMIQRPDIPGVRIELDSGNYQFTVGQTFVDLGSPRVLDEATDKSILWGKPSNGLRLGIRQSEYNRRRTTLRHGEHIDYEVWIKNETKEIVQFARDPRDLHRPRSIDNNSINLVGAGMRLSFSIPPEELTKAELILLPGQAAKRFLDFNHSACIRPPGSPRGRFGSDPLLLKPGKYSVYAQYGDLKSGVEVVEIIPAAKLQIRKSSPVTDKSREYAAQDPSEAILAWQTGDGEKHETMVNWNHGIFIDERDLTAVEIISVDGHPDLFSIALQLKPESAKWLSTQIASYSLWENPNMVAILLDEKPLGAINIPSPIPDNKLMIPLLLPRKDAEATIKNIQSAMIGK